MFLDFERSKQNSDVFIAVVGDGSCSVTAPRATHLLVCSEKLDWVGERVDTSFPTPYPSPPDHNTYIERSLKRPKAIHISQDSVVSFSSSSSSYRASPNALLREREASRLPNNLRNSMDICLYLNKGFPGLQAVQNCLGYLDVSSDEKFRHTFYRSVGHLGESMNVVALNEILTSSNLGFISFHDRLKVARTVAITALTYHSTPWLSECWRIDDIRFVVKSEDPITCFQSFHLAADLNRNGLQSSNSSSAMDGLLTPASSNLARSTEDELVSAGINNITLYNLGVALLAIDRWQEFDPDDLAKVRKAAARNSMLGPKYKDIVRKCLGCDYPQGQDLKKPKLHKAVYENVVGTLEDIIASLDLEDDK